MTDEKDANELLLLSLGDWQVFLHADVIGAKTTLRRFTDHFNNFVSYIANPGEVTGRLFITTPIGLEELDYLRWWPACEREISKEFTATIGSVYRQFFRTNSLRDSSQKQSTSLILSWSHFTDKKLADSIYSSSLPKSHRLIALIIEELDELSHLNILGNVLFLANQWHIERGGLCLHSAAVVRRNAGFLFLGASEAGKTTVSQLSNNIGYPALGDDLNFVINDGRGFYHLVAAPSPIISPVGYSPLRPPLRGIFTLVQDEHDMLTPLQPQQVARALFKEFYSETPYVKKLPDKILSLGFQICGSIARQIPGY